MQLKYKIGSVVATGALLSTLFAPAAFAATAEISGNGDGSTNTILSSNTDKTIVNQTNNTNVLTKVGVHSSTGGNTASKNTGGDVTIETGAATSSLTVEVDGGTNSANVLPCGCDGEEASSSALISGNGDGTNNLVNSSNLNKKKVNQKNKTNVKTFGKVTSKTGKNKANKNTGGTVVVTTDDAESTVGVTVNVPSNVLNP